MKRKTLLTLLSVVFLSFPAGLFAQGKIIKAGGEALVSGGGKAVSANVTRGAAGAVTKSMAEASVRSAVGEAIHQAVLRDAVNAGLERSSIGLTAEQGVRSATESSAAVTRAAGLAQKAQLAREITAQIGKDAQSIAAHASPAFARPTLNLGAAKENAENAWINSIRTSSIPDAIKQQLYTYGNKTKFLVDDYETGAFFIDPSSQLSISQIESVFAQSKVLPQLPTDKFNAGTFFHRHIMRNGQILIEGEISKAITLPEFLKKMEAFMDGKGFHQTAYNIWESADGKYMVRFGDHETEFLTSPDRFPHVHLEMMENVDNVAGVVAGEEPFNRMMQVNRSYHILIDKSRASEFLTEYPGESLHLLGEDEVKKLLSDLQALKDVPDGVRAFSAPLHKYYVRGDKSVLPKLYKKIYGEGRVPEFTPYTEEILMQDAFGNMMKRMSSVPRLSGVRDQVVSALEQQASEMEGADFVTTIKSAIVSHAH